MRISKGTLTTFTKGLPLTKSIVRAFVRNLIVGVLLVGFSSLVNASNQSGGGATSGGDPTLFLPINGVWQGSTPGTGFDENNGGVGSYFQETWVFTAPAEVQITDLLVPGDQYKIYDGVILLGASTVVPDPSTYEANDFTAPPYTTDPATAWATGAGAWGNFDPFSTFDYTFTDNGPHAIIIQETVEPTGFTDSSYSIRALAVVPEPSPMTTVLLGMGMLLALGWVRRGKLVG